MDPARLFLRSARICSISNPTWHRYLHAVAVPRPVHSRASRRVRRFHQSTKPRKDPSTQPHSPSPKTPQHAENPSLPSLNLLQQIQETRPAVRYTVYAGLALMATAESTFWFTVLKAKFFPSKSEERQLKDTQLLNDISAAVKGYRKVWMRNYARYYGAHMWGLGYGGLDGLEHEHERN